MRMCVIPLIDVPSYLINYYNDIFPDSKIIMFHTKPLAKLCEDWNLAKSDNILPPIDVSKLDPIERKKFIRETIEKMLYF